MSQPRHIAVVDIGKTNAKVVLIDALSGQQVAAHSTPNTVRQDGPYPHADVDRLWGFITENLSALHKAHGVDGISITTHGATAALIDGDELALPVLDYEFAGPEETSTAYGLARPDFRESLSPRLPNGLNLGAQIFWQSRRFPEAFARVRAILAYPQYWAWRLTGQMASEVTSLGCHTDLWAPEHASFSRLVVDEGWLGLFPPVVPAASVLGPVQPQLATRLGLSAGTPVTCGIHDSNASLLPHLGRHGESFTVVSSGTWTIVMSVGGSTASLDPDRDSLANVDAFGRPVPTARFMGGREFDLLVPLHAEPSADDIDHVLANRIMVLPSFVPGVGPHGRQEGRWSVDPSSLTPGQRTAAASFYLALMTQSCLSLCGLGQMIVLEGPVARNRLFAGTLARLTGVPVRLSGDSTGTSLGASLLFGAQGEPASESSSVAAITHPLLEAYARAWADELGGQPRVRP